MHASRLSANELKRALASRLGSLLFTINPSVSSHPLQTCTWKLILTHVHPAVLATLLVSFLEAVSAMGAHLSEERPSRGRPTHQAG